MWVLFAEIWICLLLAFGLGWFAHWFLCCRGRKEENQQANTDQTFDNEQSVEDETDTT